MEDQQIDKKEEKLLIPAHLINASSYCRRLAYLQFVHKEFEDTSDTIEGRRVHKRVDSIQGSLPQPEELKDSIQKLKIRSLTLSSDKLDLIAKMDLVETKGAYVIPIEYKKGMQKTNNSFFLPEEIQACTQALILRDNNYLCKEAFIYYAKSEKRVSVQITKQLIEKTIDTINQFKKDIQSSIAPEPIKNRSKCPRCSLVKVCLPEEWYHLKKEEQTIRPLSIKRESKLPIYIQSYKGKIFKKGYRLFMEYDDNKKSVPFQDISELVIMGNINITTVCLMELMRREIPISWHSYSGWFVGFSQGVGHKNAKLRQEQHKKSLDNSFCLNFAKDLIRAKILNCRTLLRRNWKEREKPEFSLMQLKKYADLALKAKNFEELLGIEGYCAKEYFKSFNHLIKSNSSYIFHFEKRNKRPPKDSVNLLLSFSYAMLTRLWTHSLASAGFDPFCGFYHKSSYGRPALALDMMEPFRPLICDSSVLSAINNGELSAEGFKMSGGRVDWTEKNKKAFIAVFERRLSQEITHPIFKYKLTYKQLLKIQARLFVRYIYGELDKFPHIITR